MPQENDMRRQGAGYAAEGSSFYAWDEDPETLRAWAAALRSAAAPVGPSAPEPPGAWELDQKRSV